MCSPACAYHSFFFTSHKHLWPGQ